MGTEASTTVRAPEGGTYRLGFRSKLNGCEWYSRDPMSHAQAVHLLAYYAAWNMLEVWIEPT